MSSDQIVTQGATGTVHPRTSTIDRQVILLPIDRDKDGVSHRRSYKEMWLAGRTSDEVSESQR